MAENIDIAYLSDRLRAVRKERSKTLQDVAAEVDVSIATLSRIERGEIRSVEGDTLLALAKWLKLPADHLEKPKTQPASSRVSSATPSTPDVIELHLRADPKLRPATAKALAEMFRIAYEQMARQKKNRSEE